MGNYILSIDQGTTGTTIMLVDSRDFSIIGKESREFPQIFPHPSLVEHNLEDIWDSTVKSIQKILKKNKVAGKEISCIGITNQRETIGFFDSKWNVLRNAIVWQDRRTSSRCSELKEQGYCDLFKKTTGLPIDPYFSATKVEWAIQNDKTVKKHYEKGTLRVGTIDSFLLNRLTGGKKFSTDATNASRYLLMDLKKFNWSKDLLDIFKFDESLLPEIKDSFTLFGHTENLKFLPDGIPITSILGDQQAALIGQGGTHQGALKCTYGTGAFMVLNIGKTLKYSDKGLLTTVAYKKGKEFSYALEGSSYIAGAAVQWLRDQLKFFKKSSEVEKFAKEVENSEIENLLFLPYFSGIGTPHWIPNARGIISGITRDTGIPHFSKACLEGIALSINDLLSSFKVTFKEKEIFELRVDGGATENNLLIQMQANFSQIKIIRPKVIETTGLGASFGAAVGNNSVKSLDEIQKHWKVDKTFSDEGGDYYPKKKKLWSLAVKNYYQEHNTL